eukprot:TRINITY_DN3045_c0_g1_i2.p1 TRINITY_DN3045_c0_g1~~TRINITY_DN3045_c0_g1_i2.p1  ORF type:complete len:399 (+),score=49.72 TRINITY_DN3045_c0_g1_i2:77-1273(+)
MCGLRGPSLWICGAFIVVGVAVLLSSDPLQLSPIASVPDFRALPVESPGNWHEIKQIRDGEDKLRNAEIRFKNEIMGPESLAFDLQGRGPYSGLSDGRVVRWDGPDVGWTEFAITSPNRTADCAPKDPPALNLQYEHICGRPLGLRFNPKTGDLYIADPYFGLLSVGTDGGLAQPLTTEAEGVPFAFTNDVDVAEDGVVYFTDTSTKYQRRQFFVSIVAGDDTGRLLSYNPVTRETKVLLRGLRFANGVAISKDGTFLIMCETTVGRLWKYWLKGPQAGTAELFAEVPGFPDNVRRNKDGHFWVAIHARRSSFMNFLYAYPKLRTYLLRLPMPIRNLYILLIGRPHAMILRYDPSGSLMEVLEDRAGATTRLVSEVEERDGKLWMGSVLLPQIAVYTR